MQQQESDDEDNSTNRSGLSFPGSLSELFNEQDSQQLGDLLAILSDNRQNRTQTNAVVVQQERMDRVGVEPTTSYSGFLFSRSVSLDEKKLVQIPPAPSLRCYSRFRGTRTKSRSQSAS
ncbi:MAG: hypothetical protein M3264_12920 [Thermoproteota archaeon]|nr:hypothetical protein [Thermoproteota archaeon]